MQAHQWQYQHHHVEFRYIWAWVSWEQYVLLQSQHPNCELMDLLDGWNNNMVNVPARARLVEMRPNVFVWYQWQCVRFVA